MSLFTWLWLAGGGQRAATATGTGTATGVGAATSAASGLASGLGTATGASVATGTIPAIGTAAGAGTASGLTTHTAASVGTASGTGTASALAAGGASGLTRIDLQAAIGSSGGFSDTGFQSNAFGGSPWVSILTDTRSQDPIVLDYGVQGNGPSDRVASTGTLSFTLNNAIDNAGQTVGWYSPLHVDHRDGLDLNIPIRLIFTLDGQDYHKFLGRLSDINPEPGMNGTFTVPCQAVDLMDDWAATDVPVIMAIEVDYDAATLVQILMNTLYFYAPDLLPVAQSIEAGVDLIPYAFHDPNRKKIREVLIDIVMSDLGFACFRGSPTTGGVFTLTNRHAMSTYPIQTSLLNQFLVNDGFQSVLSRDDVTSSVEVFVYPATADADLVEIFRLDGPPLLLQPFSRVTMHLPLRTADHPGEPIGALEIAPITPGVDFTVNTQSDGLGTDMTVDVTVGPVNGSGGATIALEIRNHFARPGFLTLLKGRGKGLYTSEVSARVDLDTRYGRRQLTLVMPYQGNVNVAADVAAYFANIYRAPFGQVESIRFCANKSATLMQQAIYREPGDLIYLEEAITGITDTFRIQGVHLEMDHGVIWCTWRLANIVRQQFWLLGNDDLGLTTILGF